MMVQQAYNNPTKNCTVKPSRERLDVRTYPTNYTPISAKEARELSKTRMASAYKLPKETKYKYTDPGGESTAGFIPSSEVDLPVLYIVWPTDIAVPADLDYEVLHEVFLPKRELPACAALNLSEKALQALDFETNELARRADKGLELEANIVGGGTVPDDMPLYYEVTGLMLYTLDIPGVTQGRKDVPLENLQVKFINGSSVVQTSTDRTGLFTTGNGVVSENAVIELFFQDAKRRAFELKHNASVISQGVGTVKEKARLLQKAAAEATNLSGFMQIIYDYYRTDLPGNTTVPLSEYFGSFNASL